MISLILDLKRSIKKLFKRTTARLSMLESIAVSTANRLEYLIGKEEQHMTQVAQEFEALRVALDEATTAVGVKIDALKAQIDTNMTPEEVATVKAGLQTEIDQLKGLAANPADPVPDPDPVPPADPVV